MKRVLISGDSIFFPRNDVSKEDFFITKMAKSLAGSDADIINISIPGLTNPQIFSNTVLEMTKNNYDCIFVGVVNYPKFNFPLSVDFLNEKNISPGHMIVTPTNMKHGDMYTRINSRYTERFITNLKRTLLSVPNHHYEILTIVIQVNALINLAKILNTPIYFIKTHTSWSDNYFQRLPSPVKLENLSNYLIKILDAHKLNDDDTNTLYNQMFDQYDTAGGIQEDYWFNLYENLYQPDIIVDKSKSPYPGPQVQEYLHRFLLERLPKNFKI